MVGQPQAGMGFPASLRFIPYAVLENTTAQPLTVTPGLNYMPGGSPATLPLPVQQLKPREARQLDLPSMLTNLGLGGLNGDINLTFSITGQGGDLMIATGSVDQTGNYVFPVPAEATGQSFGRSIGHWTVANGADSMYSLWNPTNAAQDFVVTLYYGDGSGQYVMTVHLAAQASTMIDVGMLIAMAQPGANGNLIPNYIQEGSVVFSNPKGRAQWMTRGLLQSAQGHLWGMVDVLLRLFRPAGDPEPVFRGDGKHGAVLHSQPGRERCGPGVNDRDAGGLEWDRVARRDAEVPGCGNSCDLGIRH
jgi:hypothetical protein